MASPRPRRKTVQKNTTRRKKTPRGRVIETPVVGKPQKWIRDNTSIPGAANRAIGRGDVSRGKRISKQGGLGLFEGPIADATPKNYTSPWNLKRRAPKKGGKK